MIWVIYVITKRLRNDYVISKLLSYHDVIDMVTHIVWIIQYESFHREEIFVVVDFVWKINLTSWLDSWTAVENRLVGKCMLGSLEKYIRSGHIWPLGGGKTIFFIIHMEIQYIWSHRFLNATSVQISKVTPDFFTESDSAGPKVYFK